jgi:DNA-binding NarL/FixJ family response regulator
MLVDDHAIVRAGYRTLLETAPEIKVVCVAANGELAHQYYLRDRPDAVIVDLSLPGISWLGTIRRVVNRFPDARILVFSMHEDTVFVEQALRGGALGYITKRSAPVVLKEAADAGHQRRSVSRQRHRATAGVSERPPRRAWI